MRERQESLRAKMMALIVASVESEADAGGSAFQDFMELAPEPREKPGQRQQDSPCSPQVREQDPNSLDFGLKWEPQWLQTTEQMIFSQVDLTICLICLFFPNYLICLFFPNY
jgi:hypothetical protein